MPEPQPTESIVPAAPRASGVQTTPRHAAHVAVQVIDQLADLAAVICLTLLCLRGKLSGELTLVGIGAVLGIQTGLRRGLSAGTGVVGLALVACGSGALVAARHLVLWMGLAVLALLCGCGPTLTAAVPGAPPVSGCAPVGASRCSGAMPEVCSASGRWWAALPAECPHGCVVEDAGARCSALDAAEDEP